MHKHNKPVRKCRDCGLNFVDHCGVFDNPHDQWHNHRRCAGYGNEELLKEYLDYKEKHPDDLDKKRRQLRAKLAKTEPHHQGVIPAESAKH